VELQDYHPAQRYSGKVESYARYRPSYPAAALDVLERECRLGCGARLADVGSGTGVFTQLLLDRGHHVFAVEINPEMRAAAEARLGSDSRLHSVAGCAEATTLPDGSVDAIVAAQAFHWFDPVRVVPEFERILRPGGGAIALIWNNRRIDADRFHAELEQAIVDGCPDYTRFQLAEVEFSVARLAQMFPGRRVVEHEFDSVHPLGLDGLHGLISSVSYCPPPGTAEHERLMVALQRLFERHHDRAVVSIRYRVQLFCLTELVPPA
jgi:SAM-dependent methyltransferase